MEICTEEAQAFISLHKWVGFCPKDQGQLHHHNLLATVEVMPETNVGVECPALRWWHLFKITSLILLQGG